MMGLNQWLLRIGNAWLGIALLQRLHPDLVINAGTAGGFAAKGAGIGDVFVSSVIRNHDRRIPLPGYDQYGVGEYHSVPTVALREVRAPSKVS